MKGGRAVNDREAARSMDGKLYRVFRCFGREFPVYSEYRDEDGNAIPGYPTFETEPQYTEDGRPFAVAPPECGCTHGATDTPGEPFGGDCGRCRYFCREPETPFSIFGICMCEARRRPRKKEEDES